MKVQKIIQICKKACDKTHVYFFFSWEWCLFWWSMKIQMIINCSKYTTKHQNIFEIAFKIKSFLKNIFNWMLAFFMSFISVATSIFFIIPHPLKLLFLFTISIYFFLVNQDHCKHYKNYHKNLCENNHLSWYIFQSIHL